LIVTETSEQSGFDKKYVNKRKQEIKKVGLRFGFKSVHELNYPAKGLDTVPFDDLISKISYIIKSVRPNILFVPNRNDVHTDHQVTFKAVMSCTKNFCLPFIQRILMYETLSETEFSPPLPENAFQPNVFIDITDTFKEKCEVLKMYETEIGESARRKAMPRNLDVVEALGRLRGSRIGVEYAESFMLLFESL